MTSKDYNMLLIWLKVGKYWPDHNLPWFSADDREGTDPATVQLVSSSSGNNLKAESLIKLTQVFRSKAQLQS